MTSLDRRTRRQARALAALAGVGVCALPLVVLILVLQPEAMATVFADAYPQAIAPPPALVWAALGTGLLPMAAAMAALWQSRLLLRLFATGDAVSRAVAGRIARLGWALMALAALSVAAPALGSVIATSANPPGQRMLAITVSSGELGLAFAAGVLLVIAHAMGRAAGLADEVRGFV